MTKRDLISIPGGRALVDLVAKVKSTTEQRWKPIEQAFVAGMAAYDAARAHGRMTDGEYRRKAGVFNDLLILLLEHATGHPMGRTEKRESLLFDEIDIDICFPANKALRPKVGAEVKVLGAPPHPGNSEKARPASQDLHKRIREVAFTSTDFKAAHAELQTITSFASWCKETRPKYFSFWALRVADDADFHRARGMLNGLQKR